MLICIPDISGFTKFMSENDKGLSSKVIPSLLNDIIYSNEIGLKVSEIEGDAVLFFKQDELPSITELMAQCSKFYLNFYAKLKVLGHRLEGIEGSDDLAKALGLKIICHLGTDIEAVTIGKHIKLMGEDVIIAHKLLKNNIESDDYVLLSESLYSKYSEQQLQEAIDWTNEIKDGDYEYEHIGIKHFKYIDLKSLRVKKAM
ncbi:DUF2652 domain-containing protein [Winogradskyella maritima]|uniref:DUF2652 domain-containing protein n=1 Tax=Winogradskyella maritima TaxID=1517766 RepID=A0ABV8AJL8_9FLAO|nr:DUF2652 domain-containing protein [Winogradskyella maritima]